MKLLIKLAITALLANAVFRVGTQYITHYQFRDSIREAAMYQAKTEDELRDRILEIAATYGLPQGAGDISVSRNGRQWTTSGTYTKKIEIVPTFPYDWKFDWDVDAFVSDAPLLPGAPTRFPQPKPK
jgi:hypothetical protein